MNWKVFLNIIIIIIGILTIIFSYITGIFIILSVGIGVGIFVVLIGVSLFIKPNWRKIIITLILTFILIAVTYFYASEESSWGADADFHGLPFPYYQCVTGYLPNTQPTTYCDFHVGPDEFPYVWLINDILFWYFISSLIVWIYDKFRKRK